MEGMEDTTQDETTLQAFDAMVIVEGHTDKEKDTQMEKRQQIKETDESIGSDALSIMTGLTKNSKYGEKAKWDELTLANDEKHVEKASHKQIQKFK